MSQNFAKKFYASELFGFGFGFPVAAGYVLLLLNLAWEDVATIIMFATTVAVLVELFLAQPMNFGVSRKVRRAIQDWEAGKIKEKKQKNEFYLQLLELPLIHSLLIFLRVTIGAVIVVVYMAIVLKIHPVVCLMSCFLATYGAYLGGILTYSYVGSLVSPYAQELVASGSIDPQLIAKRRWFGLSMRHKITLDLLIPILATNLSVVFSITSSLFTTEPATFLIQRVTGDVLVSIVTLLVSLFFVQKMTTRPLQNLEKSLTVLASGEGNYHDRIPTDLSDDFAYVSYLMNRALDNFYDVIVKLKAASEAINRSIQDLSVSSQEIAATSNQQAAGVKEIITTMEDSDHLSKKVASQATEVASIAEGTKDVVNTGFELIKQSLEKMEAIKDANGQSIQGIRSLGNKISNIWDIVNIINSIADQTKIIAFNAELEASSAGDAGRNFQIVATEIRRLADSTVHSTREIKSRITEIQNSSDHLIISSEEGTAKIIAGWELSGKLRTLFEEILNTSEISAESATKIASSIGQQVVAFDQILMTLKQISSGIDNFVTSTSSTTKLTKSLMEMSSDLHSIVEKYNEKQGD